MGNRVTCAAAHLPGEAGKRRLSHDPRFWCRQRWLSIYQALIAPRQAEEIALHTGVSVSTVRRVLSTYNRLGVAAVETPGTGGRRHQSLTLEQEQAFLQPFFTPAAAGEMATAAEIQPACEAAVQHPVHQSTIFRWLNATPGANVSRARSIPKPSRQSRPHLKNLLGDGPGRCLHPRPRRRAARVEDG